MRAKTGGVASVALFHWGEFEKCKPGVLRPDMLLCKTPIPIAKEELEEKRRNEERKLGGG